MYIYREAVKGSINQRLSIVTQLNKESNRNSDLELIREIESGNTLAFDQLYRQYYPALYLLAFKLSKSVELAKDVVSDVFLQVWEGRKGLRNVENIRGYLYISVRNRTFNYLKSKGETMGNLDESVLSSLEPTAGSFFQSLLHIETIRALREAVSALPPECKKVMELVLKGYATNDIAQMLDISASAVSHQKSRAVKLLKERIYPVILIVCLAGLSTS